MKTSQYQTGRKGEAIALSFLQKQGHKFICQRFHSYGGEIDLITKRDNTLYFTEVKYRSHHHYGHPLETITPRKKQRLKKAALHFLNTHPEFQSNYFYDFLAIGIQKTKQNLKITCTNFSID